MGEIEQRLRTRQTHCKMHGCLLHSSNSEETDEKKIRGSLCLGSVAFLALEDAASPRLAAWLFVLLSAGISATGAGLGIGLVIFIFVDPAKCE